MLPKQLTTKGAKRRKMDIPKKIGFRGRWFHGKELDDPVFKTHKIPHILIPSSTRDQLVVLWFNIHLQRLSRIGEMEVGHCYV